MSTWIREGAAGGAGIVDLGDAEYSNYQIDGDEIRHTSNGIVCSVSGSTIRDSHGDCIAEIDGDFIRENGDVTYSFDDGSINKMKKALLFAMAKEL